MREWFVIGTAYDLPTIAPVTVAGGDVNVGTITAKKLNEYSISGNCGVGGATVTLDTGASVTADGSGNFLFSRLGNGTYVVTPAATATDFTPGAWTVTVQGANVSGVNFIAVTVDVTVTVEGSGIAGAAVTLTNGETVLSGTTDLTGTVVFRQVTDGIWTVALSQDGYTYTIDEATGVISGASIEIGGISGTPVTVGGRVVDLVGAGVPGITITLTGGQSDVTDVDGYWSIGPVLDGVYSATPSLEGWTFRPVAPSFLVNRANVTVQEIEGSNLPIEGLAGYWPLLNGSAVDMSGKNHTLAIVGSLSPDIADPAGNPNKAHNFSGSDYCWMADHADLDFSTLPFSLSIWASCIGSVSDGFRNLMNKNRSTTQSPAGEYCWDLAWYLASATSAEYPRFRTDAAVIATSSGTGDLKDGSGNGNETWHHIVYVRGNGESRIYVNNVKHVVNHTSASFSNDRKFSIGGDQDGYTIKWRGGLAHARAYRNYALTDADVAALFNAKS